MTAPRIILFIASDAPTNYDRQLAASVPVPVVYRNSVKIKHNDEPEPCDGVMGAYIPKQYLGRPTANEVMAAYREAKKAEAVAVVADKEAPAKAEETSE